MKRYLIVRSECLCEDSCTYGDWRQYQCRRDNGETVLVRHSELTTIAFMFGVCLLAFVAMLVLAFRFEPGLSWPRLFGVACIGMALVAPVIVGRLTDWRLVVIVGTATRNAHGGWTRDL